MKFLFPNFGFYPKTRQHYWSCSTFAQKARQLLDVPRKPDAATSEEWDEWRQQASAKSKIGYWIIEEGLDLIQDVVYFPSDAAHAIRYYIKNRFFDKLHYLPTNLKPGHYYDLRVRLLHGMFESLVNFVEVEKTHMQLIWNSETPRPIRYRFPLLRWTSLRSREIGIKYLEWEATLDSPNLPEYEQSSHQAQVARETIALYTWWKDVRPNRPDPYEISGWTEFNSSRDGDSLMSYANDPKVKNIFNSIDDIEKAYDDEDEQMMIRLVKIHKSLWT